MRPKHLIALLVSGLLLALASSAFAGTTSTNDITFTTPTTYGSCTATTDPITATGVGTRYLQGWVSVQYVLPGGVRQQAQLYSVAQTGDLAMTVAYPPASQWPVTDPTTGVGELHVDLSIEVYPSLADAQHGWNKITTLGPGNDWDVYCNHPGGQTPTTAPRTIGYWKNHPTAWPVTTLTLGCRTIDRATALGILKNAKAKDMTSMLAAQLIAAELNVANHADDSVQPVITQANQFLCQFPVGSNPQGSNRATAEALKNALDAYNNSQGG